MNGYLNITAPSHWSQQTGWIKALAYKNYTVKVDARAVRPTSDYSFWIIFQHNGEPLGHVYKFGQAKLKSENLEGEWWLFEHDGSWHMRNVTLGILDVGTWRTIECNILEYSYAVEIDCYVDGNQKIFYYDNSPRTFDYVGLEGTWAPTWESHYDNFSVRKFAYPEPTYLIGSKETLK